MVVMGVDPGLRSIGVCVINRDRVVSALSVVSKQSERTADEHDRYMRIFEEALVTSGATVLGLEDMEPQPWRTKGRYPKGAVQMQRLVSDMRNLAQRRGVIVYTQSPDIQSKYPDKVIELALRKAVGGKVKITPHLISAAKHAFEADSTHAQVMLLKRKDG